MMMMMRNDLMWAD